MDYADVMVWDGVSWVSIRGGEGKPGKSLSLKGTKATVADLPTPGVDGDLWIVNGDGYIWDDSANPPAYQNIGALQGPPGPAGAPGAPGPKGADGINGTPGTPGTSATVTIGTVTTGAPGTKATVTNSGTASAAVLSFTIPEGVQGAVGPVGPAPTLAVGTTTTVAAGLPATVSLTPDGTAGYKLNVGVPAGEPGQSVTFKGTTAVWPPATQKVGDTWVIGSPAPAGAPAAAGHMVTFTGSTWVDAGDITGPKGDPGTPGPTAVSADAGNVATKGSDGLIYVAAGATPIATTTTLGGVKVGANLSVTADGTLSAVASAVPDATTTVKGIVMLADATAVTNKATDVAMTPAQVTGLLSTLAPIANPTFSGMIGIPTGGTANAPTLFVAGDVDTGVYAPNANTLEFSAGGTRRLGLGSTITVGSGTETVTVKGTTLTLQPTGAVAITGASVAIQGITYPATDGTAGQVLRTSGSGALSWYTLPATYTLPAATASALGGIKVGANLTVTADGTLAAVAAPPAAATTTTAGIVRIADAAAITAKATDVAVTPAQLMGQVATLAPIANPSFTGTIQIPAGGTASVPTVAVTGDTDTGVYAPAADTLEMTAGGVKRLGMSPTAVALGTGVEAIAIRGTDVALQGLVYPAKDGTAGQVLGTDGSGRLSWSTIAGAAASLPPQPGGRLSIYPTRQATVFTNSQTVYYVPHSSADISLWDGTVWRPRSFAGTVPSLTFGASKTGLFDVYARWNGTAVELYSVGYTGETSPARAPVPDNGVLVDSQDKGGLFLGRVYVDSSGSIRNNSTVAVGTAFNGIGNHYNRMPQSFLFSPGFTTVGTQPVSYNASGTPWSALNGGQGSVGQFVAPPNTLVRSNMSLHVDAGNSQFFIATLRRVNQQDDYLQRPCVCIAGALANQNVRGTSMEGFFEAAPWNEVALAGRSLTAAITHKVWAMGYHNVACPATQMVLQWDA